MRRTDLLDTKPWAHREMIRRLRKMTPGERLDLALQITQFTLEFHKAKVIGKVKRNARRPR